jgi:hypothetical protein
MRITERIEDMSRRGFLRLVMEDDGDIIVAVGQCDRDGLIDPVARVEFCTCGSGGGGSPETREALIQLMGAIARDNLNKSGKSSRNGNGITDLENEEIASFANDMKYPVQSKGSILDSIL